MMTSEDRKLAESISNVTRSKLQINASQKIETCRLSTAQTRPCAAPPIIWIFANLSSDCLQDLGQFSQRNRFSHRIERETFMAWIDNKPFLWLEICAGEMKALLEGWRRAALDFDGPQLPARQGEDEIVRTRVPRVRAVIEAG